MKKQIISIAIATALLAGTTQNVYANDQDISDNKHKQYVGTGIGAIAGALIAGPVGFIAGGLIGNLAGKHDAMHYNEEKHSLAENQLPSQAITQQAATTTETDGTGDVIILAQAGEIDSIINDDAVEHSPELQSNMVAGMGLDVFFLSGSTTVETFYKPRIEAISNLMNEISDISVHLEGYSDRRGDKDANLALSNDRLIAVRNELIQAGVDENRIHMDAYGEQKFVSQPGDLEAYTFDRRVVIRFEHITSSSKSPVAFMENSPTL